MPNGKNKEETADDKQKRADAEGKKLRQANAEDIPLGSGLAEDAKQAIIRRRNLLEQSKDW